MQKIIKVGDDLVPADKNIEDISHAANEMQNVSQKYKTDMIAVIGKGENHHIVAQYHEQDAELAADIDKTISLIQSISNNYGVDVKDVVKVIMAVICDEEE